MTDGLHSDHDRNIYDDARFTLMVNFVYAGVASWGARDYDYNFLAEVFLDNCLDDHEVFALARIDDPAYQETFRSVMAKVRSHMRLLACVEFVDVLQAWAGVSFGPDEEMVRCELDATIDLYEAERGFTYCRPPVETLFMLIARRLFLTGAKPDTAADWADVIARPTLIGVTLAEFNQARAETVVDGRLRKYGIQPERETHRALLIRAQPHLAHRCLVMSERVWPEWDGDHHALGEGIAHRLTTEELSTIANRLILMESPFDRRIDGLVYEALRSEFLATREVLDEAGKRCAIIAFPSRTAPKAHGLREQECGHHLKVSAEVISLYASDDVETMLEGAP